jgi:hypothetical protein
VTLGHVRDLGRLVPPDEGEVAEDEGLRHARPARRGADLPMLPPVFGPPIVPPRILDELEELSRRVAHQAQKIRELEDLARAGQLGLPLALPAPGPVRNGPTHHGPMRHQNRLRFIRDINAAVAGLERNYTRLTRRAIADQLGDPYKTFHRALVFHKLDDASLWPPPWPEI